jgi:hypothetical protein
MWIPEPLKNYATHYAWGQVQIGLIMDRKRPDAVGIRLHLDGYTIGLKNSRQASV